MAAGRTTKTVGDGNSGTITGGFLSSDGTNTGTLTPAPTLYSSGGTELIGTQADAVSLPTAFSTEGKAQLGALTETAPATDTASSGLNGRLQRIAQRLTSLIAFIGTFGAITAGRSVIYDTSGAAVDFTAPSPVTQSGAWTVSLASAAFDVQTTITRPANATAYTANDVVGGALDLGVLGPSGGAVLITGLQLEADITAIPSGQTSWIVHLYSVTPPSAVADNGAWGLPSGDRASYLGQIPLATMVLQAGTAATCYVEDNSLRKPVRLAGTHLFAYLVSVGGFTPAANSEVYKLTVHTLSL